MATEPADAKTKPASHLDPGELLRTLLAKAKQVTQESSQKELQAETAKRGGAASSDRPEVLIVIATEGEEYHLLDARLRDVSRTPSLYGKHQKHSVDNIKLRCGNRDVDALLLILTGRGEARACAVVQHLLWQLNAAKQMPELIINLGISATVNKDVRLADVVVAESLSRYLEDARVEDVLDSDGKATKYEIKLRRTDEPMIDSKFANLVHAKCKSNSNVVTEWRKNSDALIKSCDLVAPLNPDAAGSGENEVHKAKRSLSDAQKSKEVAQANVDHCGNTKKEKAEAAKASKQADDAYRSAELELARAKAAHNPSAYRDLADAGVVRPNEDLTPHFGIIMSGPLLVDSRIFKGIVANESDNYLALDMESGGIGWAWQEMPAETKPRLLIIRGISDYGNGSKKSMESIDNSFATEGQTEEEKKRMKALKKIAPGAVRKIAMLRSWDLMVSILAERIHEEQLPISG